jgi:hypothetical protein
MKITCNGKNLKCERMTFTIRSVWGVYLGREWR